MGKFLKKRVVVDEALSSVINLKKCTRLQITKRIWDYIKAHRLQDPKLCQFIYPDSKLAKVMGVQGEPLLFSQIGEHIEKHVVEKNKAKEEPQKTCSGIDKEK